MNQLIQMLLKQKFQQVPQQMMKQLENQLKMVNPQAYQEFQKARQNNVDPNEYLNQITNNFSPEQREQWNNLMSSIH